MTLRTLDKLEERLIAFLMAAATIVILIAVIQRYGLAQLGHLVLWSRDNGWTGLSEWSRNLYFTLLSIRLTWAQELCVYLFVWMAKFGAAYGVRTGIHVGVDVLVNRLPDVWRRRTVLFALGCGALFTAIVGSLGARLVWHLADSGQVSAVLEAPMWLVYLCLPLGSFLMSFRFLEVAWNFNKTGTLPHSNDWSDSSLGAAPEPKP